MSNKAKILNSLEEGPKSFTEIKKSTGLENGVIQHHLNSDINIKRKKGGTFTLESKCDKCDLKGLCSGNCIMHKLENERKLEITELVDEGLSQSEIARKLELSRPTVHFHVEDLRESGIIEGYLVKERVQNFLEG